MIQKTVEINNCACSAIISNPLSDYLKLADTYQKLKEGFHIRMIRKQQWQYIFLDELQYDRIMLHISKDTEVHQFIRCKLGPLGAHDTQLLETLEALIQNHNSRKLAAESLFLHRNTMVHRAQYFAEKSDFKPMILSM
jgi:sugar diacid utilization regulator